MDHGKFEQVEVRSTAELWHWLAERHAQGESVWLVTWKAATPDRYISTGEVLDALVAHGWIDGRRLKLDEERTMQLISPRKQQLWAQSYKQRAARLQAEGKMAPAGEASIIRARQSGLWTASDPVDALIDPADLTEQLAARNALAWWQASAPSYRRNILRWLAAAKTQPTRERRIGTVTDYAVMGKKVPQ